MHHLPEKKHGEPAVAGQPPAAPNELIHHTPAYRDFVGDHESTDLGSVEIDGFGMEQIAAHFDHQAGLRSRHDVHPLHETAAPTVEIERSPELVQGVAALKAFFGYANSIANRKCAPDVRQTTIAVVAFMWISQVGPFHGTSARFVAQFAGVSISVFLDRVHRWAALTGIPVPDGKPAATRKSMARGRRRAALDKAAGRTGVAVHRTELEAA